LYSKVKIQDSWLLEVYVRAIGFVTLRREKERIEFRDFLEPGRNIGCLFL
jgi:hypothetical protein